MAGDVMRPEDVNRAVVGQDAVIVILGIRENALLVRLRGAIGTPTRVRSLGTANVVDAMRRHGVRKLVVQSSFGVGDTRSRLPLKWRILFFLFLQPQIADHERQEQLVRKCTLDWVLAQPVALTDDLDRHPPFASPSGDVRSMSISRNRVALFLVSAATTDHHVRQSVALS